MTLKFLAIAMIIVGIAIIILVIWCLCKAFPEWEESMKEEKDDERR